ncbi:MAG: tetratricopeptide repeat protein, partial [Nitrospirae bacterium]|nr:tetratricopeptide repeat protein [Nitrospirota bacterium]
SNYLYAAMRLGLVKRIYWVIPQRFFEVIDAERRVKDFLRSEASLFDKSDIDKMSLKGLCVAGKVYGAELNICAAETLPSIAEPVVLDIGADYFVVYSSLRNKGMLEGMKIFFDLMGKKALKVVSAEMAYSERSASKRPFHGYVADQVGAALKDPHIMKQENPPELWRHRDIVSSLLSRGEGKGAVEYIASSGREYADESSVKMFRAVGLALVGKTDDSLGIFEDLIRQDKHYAYAVVSMGRDIALTKNAGDAERYFKKVLELRPGFPDALLGYADMLYMQKDYSGALKYYQMAEALVDSLHLQMRIADCFYLLGRMDEAVIHYEKAGSTYDEKIRFDADSNRDSLKRMLELSEKRGENREAKLARRLLNIQ